DAADVRLRAEDAELRRDDELVPPPLHRAAHQLFIKMRAVDVRRVEEVDAQLQRAIDGRQRLLLLPGPVEVAHPHAAQAHRRDGEALRSELALFHRYSFDAAMAPVTRTKPRTVISSRPATVLSRRRPSSP